MVEYIDKNIVLNWIAHHSGEHTTHNHPNTIAFAECERKYINALPSADVAPVVRCFECDKATSGDGRGAVWCRLFKMPMRERSFCSLGAKMDEESIEVPVNSLRLPNADEVAARFGLQRQNGETDNELYGRILHELLQNPYFDEEPQNVGQQ